MGNRVFNQFAADFQQTMAPTVSTRVSIQWLPEAASEATTTMVLSSPGSRYVDLRPLNNPESEDEKKFPFEWAFAGMERPLKDDWSEIEFTHDFFDSAFIIDTQKFRLGKSDVSPDRSEIPADVGYFEVMPSRERKETGAMVNPKTGKMTDYVEFWKSLDPQKSTPSDFIQLDESAEVNAADVDTFVYDIKESVTDKYEGRFIKVGKWGQGLLWDKTDKESEIPIRILRCYYDGKSWKILSEYIPTKPSNASSTLDFFPVTSTGEENVTKENEIVWECVEKYIV